MVDAPGPRKVHQKPIPRIGGIVFVLSTLALVLPVFFLNNNIGRSFREARTEFIVLLVGASFMFMVGLIDDLRSLRGYIKLLCLTAASLAICASGATMRSVSVGTWFVLETGWAAWPLTVFWIVIITVCLSVIDGLDGLAAGIAAIVCGSILLLALWSGEAAMAVLMLALLGSVTGFLFFNFYPAKIFMGDSGSMFLGFMIGAGSIICQTKTSTLVGLAIPFLVMGVPILDTGFVVIGRRILERRSIFASDRNHLHHRLLDLGLNHRTVVIVIYAVTAIGACIGVFMLTMESKWSVGLLVGGLLLLFSMFACLHGRRYRGILKALKRNWVLAHEARTEKRSFENAQVRMRESRSFHAWWEAVCVMAQKMHFQSIGVWKRCNGHYVNTCAWNTPEDIFTTDKTMKLILPLNGNGTAEWEIRARIWADSYLELSGRQAMLLGRLMDEFPPPEQEEEAEALDQLASTTRRTTIKEKTGLSLMTMTNTQTLKMPADIPAPLNILGIPVVPFESYDQALECVEEIIESDRKSWWVAINPIKIYGAWHKPELLNLLRQIDVGICDGVGVSIASMILHGRSIMRCTGCDLFFKLLFLASQKGWGIYLLGASAQSNAAARSELQKMYPDLRIVGWQDGYFENSQTVIEQINSSKADLLFVAMGSPKQEQWICHHRHAIDTNFCMGVGGSFDIVSGRLRRAPKIFRMAGIEFLFRLIREPLKRWPMQKVLFPYFLRVVGKKMVDLTMSDEGRKD
ncbi:MAG: WecB/TagA/CpsF family glycosyltransferase [Sedimentisphaerales bacterium]